MAAAFRASQITIAPGAERAYREADWRDALVVVEHGELELECTSGGTRRFAGGAVLFLSGLPLRLLRNAGPEKAVLTAIRRARVRDDRLSEVTE
jgi:hypothetical protein